MTEVAQQVRDLSSIREQLVDLAASDVGCTDALCLCRTRLGRAVPIAGPSVRRRRA